MMKRLTALFFLVSLLLLSGCIDSSNAIQVNQDGSATLEATRRLDTRFSDNFVSDNGSEFSPGTPDIERICDQLADTSNYPEDANLKLIKTDSNCGVTVTLDVEAGSNLGENLAEMEQSAFGPMSSLFRSPDSAEYAIERRDDQWIFKMPSPSVSQLDTDFMTKRDAESILARSTFEYEVTLPGTAIPEENNADNVDGGTFSWTINPTADSIQLEARTRPPEESLWERFGLIALIGVAIILLSIATFIGFRSAKSKGRLSRKRAESSVSSTSRSPGAADHSPADTSEPETPEENPIPDLSSLPLGAAKPLWNADAEMWMSDHEDEGVFFFDEATERWTPLR